MPNTAPIPDSKKAGPKADLLVLDTTAVVRYARIDSTAMPSDDSLLMGITSFTLVGSLGECRRLGRPPTVFIRYHDPGTASTGVSFRRAIACSKRESHPTGRVRPSWSRHISNGTEHPGRSEGDGPPITPTPDPNRARHRDPGASCSARKAGRCVPYPRCRFTRTDRGGTLPPRSVLVMSRCRPCPSDVTPPGSRRNPACPAAATAPGWTPPPNSRSPARTPSAAP